MIISLKDLKKGDKVWCGGNSGFCDSDIEFVEKVSYRHNRKTGEKYKVIHLDEDRKFDSRNGKALNPPTAYCIRPCDQSYEVD